MNHAKTLWTSVITLFLLFLVICRPIVSQDLGDGGLGGGSGGGITEESDPIHRAWTNTGGTIGGTLDVAGHLSVASNVTISGNVDVGGNTASNGTFTGTHTGDGSGLTNIPASAITDVLSEGTNILAYAASITWEPTHIVEHLTLTNTCTLSISNTVTAPILTLIVYGTNSMSFTGIEVDGDWVQTETNVMSFIRGAGTWEQLAHGK